MPDVIELLADLVAIPSLNPFGRESPGPGYGEAGVADYLTDLLQRHGIRAERRAVYPGRANILAVVPGTQGRGALLFETHMDTVGVDQMTIEPFRPVQKDGRLYGRGACDAKASLAAMTVMLLGLAEDPPPADVWLCAAVDEEFTFGGAAHLVASGFRADAVLVGEPTKLQLVTAHKGAMRWKLTTHGRAAHSATPWEGDSAIYRMAPVLGALEEYASALQAQTPHPRLGPRTLSVGTIEGGQAVNVVPDRCTITVDRRVLPGEGLEEVAAGLWGWLQKRGLAGVCEGHEVLRDSAMETDEGAPWPQAALAAARRVRPTASAAVQYGTDASKFSGVGMPAVVLGPGDIAQAHTAEEWVSIEDVREAAAVYHEVARSGVPTGR